MTFYLLDKNKIPKKSVECKTFWDFYDDRNKLISGIKFIKWKDSKGYKYVMDLDRDNVKYSSPENPNKFYMWTQYVAFKTPITDYEEDACF